MSGNKAEYTAAVVEICQAIRDGLPFEEMAELPAVRDAVEAGLIDFELIKNAWM